MIQLKPTPYDAFLCPECSSKPAVQRIVVPGMNMYAECACEKCGLEFMSMLPIGHFINAPQIVRKDNYHLYNGNHSYEWLSRIVLKSFPQVKDRVVIKKVVYQHYNDVIILNTLDFLYGHTLLKLYNAQHHLTNDKNQGLIIILPKMFEWMIPAGCAEAWIVDLKLDELQKGYDAITEFVEEEFKRFSKVSLSKAYSHPEFLTVDIERFTGIKPFDLDDFHKKEPCITFILREDRWWLSDPAEYWFYRFCRKFNLLRIANSFLSKRQNRLIRKTITTFKKEYPSAYFNIVGLGRAGGFDGYANDRRTMKSDAATEKEWCSIYGKSHVVIGFHGSNMLLPTAFAAGCVEILPEDRYGNIVQDISVRHAGRQQLFFYRFVGQYSKARTVARQAIAIIRDYKTFRLNMCSNVYPHDVDQLPK